MDVVYTYWAANKTRLDGQHKVAAVSNFFAQKNGYRTVLYTDETGFKLLRNINFSHVEIFQNKELIIPKDFWSAAKFVTFTKMASPFMHIDLDLFLVTNSFTNKIKGSDLFYLHSEPWIEQKKYDEFIFRCMDISKNPFDLSNIKSFPARNMALFGSTNTEGVKKIKEYSEKMLTFIEDNYRLFCRKQKNSYFDIFDEYYRTVYRELQFGICISFEQMLFINLIANELDNVTALYENIDNPHELSISGLSNFGSNTKLINYHVYHLWGEKQRCMPVINKLIEKFNIKY